MDFRVDFWLVVLDLRFFGGLLENCFSGAVRMRGTAKKLLFRVGAPEGLKSGSESGRKGVGMPLFAAGGVIGCFGGFDLRGVPLELFGRKV